MIPAEDALPILYSFRRCPYAIRARLALKASGTKVELREVLLRDKPAALLAVSPKATVPVLHLPDGSVLEQSLDIMQWALARHDPERWLLRPESGPEMRSVSDALIALNDGPFKQALDRYKYAPRHPERSPQAWRDAALELMPARLNERLQKHACLLGDRPTLADMAILPFVRQFAGVDPAWFQAGPLTHLGDWLQRLTCAPLFDSVMGKHPAWQAGERGIAF